MTEETEGVTTDPKCTWAFSDEGSWLAGCGKEFEFTNDGPKENGFKFCYSCGKPLEVDDTYGPDQFGDFIDPDEPEEDEE